MTTNVLESTTNLNIIDNEVPVFIDNFASATKALIEYVLEDVVCDNLSESVKASLSLRNPSAPNEPSIDFKGENDASCMLFLHLKSIGQSKDIEGNHWEILQVSVDVNWPSWSAIDSKIALPRAQLIYDITLFAEKINKHFAEDTVYHMLFTKQEWEAFQKSKSDSRSESIATNIVRNAHERKRMRAKSFSKMIFNTLIAELPIKDYFVDCDEKKYKLRPNDNHSAAQLWRLV